MNAIEITVYIITALLAVLAIGIAGWTGHMVDQILNAS